MTFTPGVPKQTRGRPKTNPKSRFLKLVNVSSDPNACWNWLGYCNKGYAQFKLSTGNTTSGHRYAYIMTHGNIPEGLHIDHLCSNKKCVNPSHLEAVTVAENNRRSLERRGIISKGPKRHKKSRPYLYTP